MLNWLGAARQAARSLAQPRRAALQAKLQRDPYYRLQSLEEVAIAADLGLRLDVNRAGVDDWLRLPGISIRQARSLVELTSSGVQLLCLEDISAALGLPGDRLRPLAPLLRFTYYDRDSDTQPLRLNPNLASETELAQIPLLPPPLCARLLREREQGGPFRDLADLQQRLGLPAERTAQLMHYLRFG